GWCKRPVWCSPIRRPSAAGCLASPSMALRSDCLAEGFIMTTDARGAAPQSDQRDEVFGPQALRPKNGIVTDASRDDDDYCVSIATMPPGVVVPLHSHADRETFYILSGEMQGYDGDAAAWRTLRAGDIFDVT